MRRALVLTDETARHPFRAGLLPRTRKIGDAENRRSWRLNFGFDTQDLRHAAQTYGAGFLATATFFY